MAKSASAIPNFKSAATQRAIIIGMASTTLTLFVAVPVYNKFVAPALTTITDKVRAAGFLPSA